MKSVLVNCVVALALALPAVPQGILIAGNAANQSGNIAPGSIVSISEFFVLTQPTAGDLDPLHSRLSLQPQGSAVSIPLRVLPGSTPFTIYCLLPDTAPLGPASLLLDQEGQSRISLPVTIAPVSPGLFAQSQNISATAPPSLNALTNPALPGQFVTLWGTGLGSSTAADLQVRIAGTLVSATYAGHVASSPGMDQINFQLPGNISAGCYVPVSLRAGAAVSNEVTIAVNDFPEACPHPLGLTPADLLTLDQGGSILLGSIAISRTRSQPALMALGDGSYEGASAQFGNKNALAIAALSQPQLPDSQLFTCRIPGSSTTFFVPDGSQDSADAGPALSLSSAAGETFALDKIGSSFLIPSSGGEYTGSPGPISAFSPDFLAPGAWTLSAPGGKTIAAFSQPFSLPALHWLNRAAFATVSRSAGATIWWDSRSVAATDVVSVELSNTSYPNLSCRTPARSGRLSLPPALLQQLSPSAETVLSVTLAPHPAHRLLFRIPLAAGGSAPAVLDYSFTDELLVDLQ